MAKQPKVTLKLQVTGGQANPAPPLGPALSQHRVNIGQFISEFNEQTSDQMGIPLPVVVRIYGDGSFEFDVKKPPVSYLIKRTAEVAKGAGEAGKEVVGSLTEEQVEEIAQEKMEDLNARDLEAAKNIVKGTARSCGIEVMAEGEEQEQEQDKEEEEEELVETE
ncbi:MAG: 50S ribosomal protein L11 [Planctomycetes bacterium]|nr:50S ribosomal protein L11 [Planctomycetota bacterium]